MFLKIFLNFKRKQQNKTQNLNNITYCVIGGSLTVSEYNPLNNYSAISIFLSFLFLGMSIILLLSKAYLLEKSFVQKIIRKKPIFFILLLGVFFERSVFNLSEKHFNIYLFISNLIFISFALLRFGIIIKNNFALSLPIWFCNIVIILAIISSLIRGFVRLGYAIETFPKNNPHILYFWGETSNFVRVSPRRIIKTIMTAPENPAQKNYKINLTALGLTAVGVTFAGGVWWETRITNQINQHNVNITEINSDRQAVKDGFLTKENYDKKWDEFGRPKKVQ